MSNTLLVVAHPDDEIIFAYSLLKNRNVNKVICCTNASNIIRCKEFKEVLEFLNIDNEIWDFPDVWGGTFPDEIQSLLKLEIIKYDNIITHNAVGEYGHTQHKALYEILNKLVSKNFFVLGEDLNFLNFKMLEGKIQLLTKYASQYNINAYDWKNDHQYLMHYVANEGIRKIR